MSEKETLTRCLRNAQEGDAASFDRLVVSHQHQVIAYAFTLTGDWHLAEDVAQEAFIAAWREIGTLRHSFAFSRWLRKLVFKYADRVRRTHRATLPLGTAGKIPAFLSDPAGQLVDQEHEEALSQALLSLSEAERAAVSLYYLEGHTQAEIAGLLGVSAAAVKKRMERGRTKLRKEFVAMSLVDSSIENENSFQTTRFAEVNRLLRDLVTGLDADPQVASAYLARFGADEGLGAQNDAWASLNLHVVIRDAYLDHFAAGRLTYVRRVREPLLWVEAPQNAPEQGYYLMTLYDGEQGPYEVNWYWKPLSGYDTIPEQTVLLVNKDTLPSGPPVVWRESAPEPPPALAALCSQQSDAEKHREALRNHISLFWAMWLISARYILRNPNEERMNFVPMLRNLLRSTRQELSDAIARSDNTDSEEASQPTPQAKIALLENLATEMENLHSRALAADAVVPVAIVPRARRFLASVAATIGK